MRLTDCVSRVELASNRNCVSRMLLWLAVILVAAATAIGTDIWLRPSSSITMAQAASPALSSLRPSSSTQSTPPPALNRTPSPERLLFAESETSMGVRASCIPPSDWMVHVVHKGSTLLSLAQRYGTDIATLKSVNCLNTASIFVGQRIYVPGPAIQAAMATVLPSPSLAATASPTASAPPLTALTAASAMIPANIPDSGAVAIPRLHMLTPEPAVSTQPTTVSPILTVPASPTAAPQPAHASAAFQVDIPDRYLHIILLGSDRRVNGRTWRTDTMIVVSVDLEDNTVRLLHIPRDLWVDIPGHGYNRINTADLWGELDKKGTGPERVKQTIYYNLGIPIHYYFHADMQGFVKFIDTVGGLDIDVDCPLPDLDLAAGIHHMDGNDTLNYARSRKTTSDFDRGRRQQKVLVALWDQALTVDTIAQLPQLWSTLADSFQTDLPLSQVINLAYVGLQLKPQFIISKAISGREVKDWRTPQGAAVVLPREDRMRTLLESLYAPVDRSKLDAADDVRVQILNGVQRPDVEQLAAAALRWHGFNVVSTGLADERDHVQTKVRLYGGTMAIARQLAQSLNVPLTAVEDLTTVQNQPALPNRADIQIILGQDYDPCQR